MMRLFFFTLIALTTFPALAQTRVVGDTFGTGRESHQQDVEKLRQQWLYDHAATEGDRAGKREVIEQQREEQRESSAKASADWFQNWTDAEGSRSAALEAENTARASHQSTIESRPNQWWGTDNLNQ